MDEHRDMRLERTVHSIGRTLRLFKGLPNEEAGMVQMYYSAGLGIDAIAEVCDQSSADVRAAVEGFLRCVIGADSHIRQQAMADSAKQGIQDAQSEQFVQRFIKESSVSESPSAIIREQIGTAIELSIPPESKVKVIRLPRFDMPLYRVLRSAAGSAFDACLALGEGIAEHDIGLGVRPYAHHDIRVTKEGQEQPVEELWYVLTFDRPLSEVSPVAFCFTGLDREGKEKRFELPIRRMDLGGRTEWAFRVETQEQEDAFGDRRGDVEISFRLFAQDDK